MKALKIPIACYTIIHIIVFISRAVNDNIRHNLCISSFLSLCHSVIAL